MIISDNASHSSNIADRLEFLSFILSSSALKMSLQQLNDLWNLLNDKCIVESDKQAFYKLLKEACTQYSTVINIQLFKSKILELQLL
jgi:hypothetical protein